MTYEEWLHKICNSTDMKNEDQVTELIRFLLNELMRERDLAEVEDDKLQELLSAKDYDEWAKSAGKEVWKKEVERMEDTEFKRFCLEHMDEVEEVLKNV